MITKTFASIAGLLLLLLACEPAPQSADETTDAVAEKPQIGAVNEYVATIMKRYEIPGVALAIIENGEVIHRRNYGLASVEHDVPIMDASLFRVYSLTKLILSTSVFQLVESGQLDLEDLVSDHFGPWPRHWGDIRIKHLLTHSSGLPDLNDHRLLPEAEAFAATAAETIRFNPGDRYDYCQTNSWLLARIIEQITGESFEDFSLKGQFANQQSGVLYSSDPRDVIANRATAYYPFESGYRQISTRPDFSYFHSSNGLNITLDALVGWSQALDEGTLLHTETKAKMWTRFPYKSDRQFSYGWDIRRVNGTDSYGFSGSLITALRKFPAQDLTVIFLGNGLGKIFNIEDPVSHLAGMANPNLIDPQGNSFEALISGVENEGFAGLAAAYREQRADQRNEAVDFEDILNSIGYFQMRAGALAEAIKIFELNVAEHPTSWNVYDSLAEAYQENGETDKSIQHYEKSVALNPQNTNGIERLRELKALR